MTGKWKIISGIIGLFILCGGLLIYLDTVQVQKIKEGSNLPFSLWSILLLGALLLCTLILINNGCLRISKEISKYKQQLLDTDDALKEAQTEFNETVERRTFEISVINASLNREIAERIQAESESKQLQRRMELILESAGEGIFGLDTDGNVTFVNKAATEMLGWKVDEMIGKSHHNLVHHTRDDGSTYPLEECPIYMAYRDGQVHFKEDDVFWTQDGKNFHVEYISTPIFEKENLVGAVVVFSDISRRLKTEEEKNKLQRRMELILDSAGEGIFGLDTDGNVTFVNKAATEMLGWKADEMIGKSHHNLVHHTRDDGSTYPLEECPIHMAYRDGQVHFKEDDVFWTQDGKNFHVEYISTPIFEKDNLVGAVVVFSDISRRLKTEEEKNKLQRQMELILDSAGEGIFGLDIDGNVIFVNKAATEMLGWKADEMIGKSHHNLVHHTRDDGSTYPLEECPIHMAYMDGQVHFNSDDVFWCKDGSHFPVEYVSTPIMENGSLTGAVIVFRDMNTFV